MRITDTADLWWKNAVVYCLDVETFMDWDDDGCGDFAGLAQRLDYLADLGVTCLWLMPFYPTGRPRRRLRHHRLLRRRPAAGHARRPRRGGPHGERPRHAGDRRPGRQPHLRQAPVVPRGRVVESTRRTATSTSGAPTRRRTRSKRGRVPRPGEQHLAAVGEDRGVVPAPLLQAAARPQRHQPAGARRDRQGDGLLAGARPVRVPGGRRPVPAGDRRASTRPRRGGCPTRTSSCATLRAFVGRRTGDGVLLGEVNLPHRAAGAVLRRPGRRRADHAVRLHQRCSTSTCRWPAADAGPLAQALTARPAISPDNQWATFVRNHDELTLDKLSDAEREEVFAAFGPDPEHAGLRPRPAPPAAADAGRRPAADPDGLQPAVLPARHPGAVLRRGDRHGGGPRPRRPDGGAHADAVDRRAQRRLLPGAEAPAAPAGGERRLRAGARQRRRPAHRPRLAAVVHEAADPPLPGVPGAGLGRVRAAATSRTPTCSRTSAAGRTARWSPLHNLGRRAAHRAADAGRTATARTGWTTCCRTAATPLSDKGRAELRAGGLRLPLAAGGRARAAAGCSDSPAAEEHGR